MHTHIELYYTIETKKLKTIFLINDSCNGVCFLDAYMFHRHINCLYPIIVHEMKYYFKLQNIAKFVNTSTISCAISIHPDFLELCKRFYYFFFSLNILVDNSDQFASYNLSFSKSYLFSYMQTFYS